MRFLPLAMLAISYVSHSAIGSEEGAPITLTHGIVMIEGAAGSDTVKITSDDRGLSVSLSGRVQSTRFFSWRGEQATNVRFIVFDGFSGNDEFENHTDIPSIVYGGSGDDRIIGGGGWNHLDGGSGNDHLEVKPQSARASTRGQNRLDPGSGNDFVRYNDGDLVIEGSGITTSKMNEPITTSLRIPD